MVDLAGGCDDIQEAGAPSMSLSWDQVATSSQYKGLTSYKMKVAIMVSRILS